AEDDLYAPFQEDLEGASCGQEARDEVCLGKLCLARQKFKRKLEASRRVGQRLRSVIRRIESGTEEDMHTVDLGPAEARLLKVLTQGWASLACTEMCELYVPVFYMMFSSLLRAAEHNRTYFRIFRLETASEFHDGLQGNCLAVAIEVVVFLALQMWLYRMFGINLWEFTGTLVRLDYSFYAFATSCCFIAFLAMTIEHFGTWGLMDVVTEQ
ncbi:unnamed protein product, partial [Symbiodinium natans]